MQQGSAGQRLRSLWDQRGRHASARTAALSQKQAMRPAILAAALATLAGSLAPPPRRASIRPARSANNAPCHRPLGRAGRTRLNVLETDEEAIKEAKADKYKQALMEEWSSAWEEEGEKEGLDWEFEKMRSVTQRGSFNDLPYAIDARRLHQTRSWVAYLSILSRFGPRRGRRGVSERERRRCNGVRLLAPTRSPRRRRRDAA